MHPRPRLRARVLVFTALYAAMLFCIVFLLTSHAQRAQTQVRQLVAVDLRSVSQLEDLVRNQSAFASQWRTAAVGGRGRVSAVAGKYPIVEQLLDIEPLASAGIVPLRDAIHAYAYDMQETSARWQSLAAGERNDAVSRLDRSSALVIEQAARETGKRRKDLERRLPALRRSARDLSAIALAVSYIIVILSFAVARVTLAKVVRPVEALVTAAERIAEGDLSARAPVGGDHEVAQLGAAFNRMADEIARARQQLEERARTDELTGLPNFRAFTELLEQELKRAGRYGETFGLLIGDLDHFKAFNDRFGHPAGNLALQAAAEAVRSSLREADTPARYGGEEFVAILPNTQATEVAAVAERVRAAVEAIVPEPGRSPLTISIGASVFPADGSTAERLMAAADARLYEAKGRGRNRAVGPSRASTRTA
jgi:diguanylate cyclase (GGDEF)-like protein